MDSTENWMELMRLVERLEAEPAAVRYGEPAEKIINKYPAWQSNTAMLLSTSALTHCGKPEQRRKVRHYTAATGM